MKNISEIVCKHHAFVDNFCAALCEGVNDVAASASLSVPRESESIRKIADEATAAIEKDKDLVKHPDQASEYRAFMAGLLKDALAAMEKINKLSSR